jgi:multiple sugar transport system substrate-binding protein
VYNVNMDSKKKKLLIILLGILLFLILLLVIVLISLGKEDTGIPTDTNQPSAGDVQLVYWGLWEPESVMQPIIDEYESLNPGVKIYYTQENFRDYENRLYTSLGQSTTSQEPAPDIMRINNTWTPKFYKYLAPLPSSIMSPEVYADTFYPTAVSDFTAKDGNIYAMPWEIDGLAVFYNKQLLASEGYDEPPRDWESFIELAQKLTVKGDNGRITQSGLAIGTSRNINHSADILSFLMLLNNANIIDSTYTETNLTSGSVEIAVNTYTSFAKGTDAIWSTDLPNDLIMFYQGKLAMMFGPSWRAFDIVNGAPSIEFGIAPLPQLANNDPVYYSMYWGDTVSKTCQNPNVAWDFIKFLNEKQEQIFASSSTLRLFGEPYSKVSLNEKMSENPYLEAYSIMAPDMKSWSMGEQNFVETTLNDAITRIVEDGDTVKESMTRAQQDINDQLAESNK